MQAYGCKALDNIDRLDFEADLYKRSPPYRRGVFVFDVQLVRTLCQEIIEEKDPLRVE
jgi:hypothetical protein